MGLDIRRIVLSAGFLVAMLLADGAHSCSIGRDPVGFDQDQIILIGRISAHHDQLLERGPAIGFEISPAKIFSTGDATALTQRTIVPVDISSFCSANGFYPDDERLEEYAIGKLVALDIDPDRIEDPIIAYGAIGFSLEMIHDSCDLDTFPMVQDNWDIPRQCGSAYFHANALAAGLPSFDDDEIDRSLRFLATYPGPIRYEDLVTRFASDEPSRTKYLKIRYGELTTQSCEEFSYSKTIPHDERLFLSELCYGWSEKRPEPQSKNAED